VSEDSNCGEVMCWMDGRMVGGPEHFCRLTCSDRCVLFKRETRRAKKIMSKLASVAVVSRKAGDTAAEISPEAVITRSSVDTRA